MFMKPLQQVASTLSFSLILTGLCFGQTTERVSVNARGNQALGASYHPSISADGRYVAFESYANNLVPGDTNGTWDIFVHDRQTVVMEHVSVDSQGVQGNNLSRNPSISADGRYVTFESYATNLVPGDTNANPDIFVHDRQTGVTERVSVDSQGVQSNSMSRNASISADGHHVSFNSHANNLVPGDTNWTEDTFTHNRLTGATKRVSVNSRGVQANHTSYKSSNSADGRYVVFTSDANNLVPGDTNYDPDIFVHDCQTGVTERVSVDSFGAQGHGQSGIRGPSCLSADGRYVAFQSEASNLVLGDTNGLADVFVHDRQTGVTERVSVDSFGAQANGYGNESDYPSISANGRYVAFESGADNFVPGDTNGRLDAFVHDRRTGVTERVSVNSFGTQDSWSSTHSSISADGQHVAFDANSSDLVPGDTNGTWDIFVHDRWNGLGENSIFLDGPAAAAVQVPLDLSWCTTRGNSKYALTVSTNRNGAVIDGHTFDIGNRMTVIASGTNATNGTGSFTSLPVESRAAGLTVYFEVAARDAAGILYDSNVLAVTFY